MASFSAVTGLQLPKPLIFDAQTIEKAIASDEALIASQAEGFRALSAGKVSVPPVQSMGQPPFHEFLAGGDSQTCVKSGYIAGDEHYVIKVAPGGVPHNASRGLPVNTGLMMLFSQVTARLEAILLDEGLLTEMRTAAAAALASSLLGPKDVDVIGLIGTGIQAHWQLRFLKAVTPVRRVLVHSRSRGKVEEFCKAARLDGWQAEFATAESLASQCRLIHTVTTSRAPLLKQEWVKDGTHITAVGADVPGKQELDPALVARADLLVCDSLQQTFERGEFQHAAAAGMIDKGRVVELGSLLEKPELHRGARDSRITVFDSSGVAVQDVMIAKAVYFALTSAASKL